MKTLRSAPAWIAAVLLLAIAWLLVEFGRLYSMDHALADRLAATGAILGGLIGAGGVALAVYLTLAAQREDEAEKVEASLRAEVAEFARLAMGPLDILVEALSADSQGVERALVRELVVMPEPVVYKATADRLSRLWYGPLLVTFHTRIAEAQQYANLISLSPTRAIRGLEIPNYLTAHDKKVLTQAWHDICDIAQTILRQDPAASQRANDAQRETLKNLDGALERAGAALGARTGDEQPES